MDAPSTHYDRKWRRPPVSTLFLPMIVIALGVYVVGTLEWNRLTERPRLLVATHAACKWHKYADFPHARQARGETREKIVFVKVTKTAGSVVASILGRYSIHHGLRALIPPEGTANIVGEADIRTQMTLHDQDEVDVFLSHATYNQSLFEHYLGSTRPFRMTIVREPVDRAKSGYFWGRHLEENGYGNLAGFVCVDIKDYREWAEKCFFVEPGSQLRYMRPRDWPGPATADIDRTFNHFDHVFVTDRMGESLVTLLPKMRMNLEELLSLSAKSGKASEAQENMTHADHAEFDRLLRQRTGGDEDPDQKLYKLAVQKLEKEFAALPRELKRAMPDIQTMYSEIHEECQERRRPCLYPGVACADECIREWVENNVYCQ